jgi:predicted DNA-binding transcriptional regulator AlpA
MKQEKREEEHFFVTDKSGKKIGKLIFDETVEEVREEENEQMLTRKEVMALLKISYPTIVRWDRKGVLDPVVFPGTKKVLYRKSDIDRLMRERGE